MDLDKRYRTETGKKHPPANWKLNLQTPLNQRGSILIGLILAILLISAIGAALLSQATTATFHTVSSNSGDRAFYLAESGYRYAAVKMAAGADLNHLHGNTYALSPTEHFSLAFQPSLFNVVAANNSWLTVQVPYGTAPVLAGQTGRLKINKGATETYNQVQNQSGNQIRFRRAAGNWTAAVGDTVELVALSDGTPVAQGGDLHLQAATRADNFPEHNGRIQLNGVLYRYTTRESTRLRGISRVDDIWAPLTPASGDDIILQPFVKVDSTGTFGQGALGANRLITNHVPLGTGGMPAGEWHDPFNDRANWNSAAGSHAVVDKDGNALSVTGGNQSGGNYYRSQLNLNRSAADVNLAQSWSDSGGFLNYDAQVKILPEEPYYQTGISFRVDQNGNSYGVSFLKASTGNDRIPKAFVPINDQLMVVLWELIGKNNWHWLAYKTLDEGDFAPFFEDDMEGGTAKWTADAPWALVVNSPPANDPPSPSHCWHDSPSGDSPEGTDLSIESISFDLTAAVKPQLRFYHHFDLYRFWLLGWYEDFADVEISNDGGASWTRLARYTGVRTSWTLINIDLTSYIASNPGADVSNVKIRFRLQIRDWQWFGNSSGDGWYIDDVRIIDAHVNWPTLLVRVREKVADGGTPFAGQRVNDIQVFFGDSAPSGRPDGNPLDSERLANARDHVNWPPENINEIDAAKDYFSLVQWDAINNLASVALLDSPGFEENTILRSNNPILTTMGSFPPNRPEIGLHAWGIHWSDGHMVKPILPPDIYYDDFAIQLPGGSGTYGFLPALQE